MSARLAIAAAVALAASAYVTWPLMERDWSLMLSRGGASEPALSALSALSAPSASGEKCFELIHVNPPRGYAYIFDACRGSVQQVLVPLPPPPPEHKPEVPDVQPNPERKVPS